jgi:hypothetical protein
MLMKEGFQPFAISQGGSRDPIKRNYTKHLIRLRHNEASAELSGGVLPEVILLNSHDGTSSYQLSSGLFRTVCANGIIIASAMFDSVRVLHKGDVVDKVVNGCKELVTHFPKVDDLIKRMIDLPMTFAEQVEFAIKALEIKYPDPSTRPCIKASELVAIRRMEDANPNLWTTLNKAQESIMTGGGISYVHTSAHGARSSRRLRPITGIDMSVNFNRELWKLAEHTLAMASSIFATP